MPMRASIRPDPLGYFIYHSLTSFVVIFSTKSIVRNLQMIEFGRPYCPISDSDLHMDFHHDRLTFERVGMCQKTHARGELYRNNVFRSACELKRSRIANIWEQAERKWKRKRKKEKKMRKEETKINESRSNRSKRKRKSRTTREKPKE
jgi:hypothetical protein